MKQLLILSFAFLAITGCRKIEVDGEKEISELLEDEIISRYYFQEGRAQQQLQADPVVRKGIEILQTPTQYNTILKI